MSLAKSMRKLTTMHVNTLKEEMKSVNRGSPRFILNVICSAFSVLFLNKRENGSGRAQ